MSRNRKKSYYFGIYAEKCAALFLRLKGYHILAERYRNPKGEIDIVALKGDMLIVVEVKARAAMASGAESVDGRKQQKILAAVEWLLAGRGKIAGLAGGAERNIRFDVILVSPWQWPVHVKDAWRI